MEGKGGRPFGRYKIETREELQALIDEYFSNCDGNEERTLIGTGDNARWVDIPKPEAYGWTELANHIGIRRKTLNSYAETDLFGDIVCDAKDKVNAQWEKCLQRLGNNSGVQYALENNRDHEEDPYTSTKNINVGGQEGNPILTENKQALTEEDARRILKIMGEYE